MSGIPSRPALTLLTIVLAFLIPLQTARGQLATPQKVQLNGHTFTLPAGFEISLVAGPPLVERPVTADFDDHGRLYVADSSGSNENVMLQLKKKPHRIVRLDATDGEGRFTKSTVFADKMMFPAGTLWHAGSLYVSAPPSIWKLTDTNGSGVANQREEWFQGKTLTGCANDLHGPYLGPDGLIYWCKGAFAKQAYERPGKEPFVTRAAHVFRAKPDGSNIEPVMTGGMDNPVDVAFTPGGERIITTTFFQHPAGGKRDGLVHIVYGGIYGKDHDPIYEHKWTSPALMPVLAHLGPAAPAGLHRYESSAFGPEYKDNLFAALFNLQKVTRHVLEPEGATFRCRTEDFVVSDNKDFHPTDVIEDADGSLLIVDTGGWYKLCCPSSQLYKPDIKGAIYRVRRTGAPRLQDPRGLKLAWATMNADELAELLGDPRPAVQHRAIEMLGARADAVPVLTRVIESSRDAAARLAAVWVLTRSSQPTARTGVRHALIDADEAVRQAALHSVSVWRDGDAVPALLDILKKPSLHNRRAAAEGLGRIADKAAVPALLTALVEPSDRALEHSLTYALIEIGDPSSTALGLKSNNGNVQRAAMTALDQMGHGTQTLDNVLSSLASKDARLKETAWWIAGRHVEWAPQLAANLRERLDSAHSSAQEANDLVRQLTRLARAPAIQTLLVNQLTDKKTPLAGRRLALDAMAQAQLNTAPTIWLTALAKTMTDAPGLLVPAVATARSLHWNKQRPAELIAALKEVAASQASPTDVRLDALAALPDGSNTLDDAQFAFVRDNLKIGQPTALRGLAADALSRAKLTTEQLLALSESLKTVGPLELQRTLDAFARSSDDQVGLRLVEALKVPSVRTAVRADMIKPVLAKYGPAVQKGAHELFALLDADNGKQKTRLEELLATLPAGDVRRGQAVFNNAKVACVTCHSIGYLGGKVGPDLTRIGSIRTPRDLLEAIVFPNSSFVRGYEPYLAVMKSGKTHNGILRKDSPDEVVLVLGAEQEIHLARSDIEELQPSRVSVMPSGLEQQLSKQDLADLAAFLKACR